MLGFVIKCPSTGYFALPFYCGHIRFPLTERERKIDCTVFPTLAHLQFAVDKYKIKNYEIESANN